MAKTIGIGIQDFEQLVSGGYFYIDKTKFIKEWWEKGDSVTLITRPRRFGKTLAMSMLERFFSIKYAGQGTLFEGLEIWEDERYRKLQGTYPVISLSFAEIKEPSFEVARLKINMLLEQLYEEKFFLKNGELLTHVEKDYYNSVSRDMNEVDASFAIPRLSEFLSRYYGKDVIILVDGHDIPMQAAYQNGYWEEMNRFAGSIFVNAFKTNTYLERGMITGRSATSKEGVFSILNHMQVITSTSNMYTDIFGFTEEEVFAAMDERELTDWDRVKKWYGGFRFGEGKEIYNPWSVLGYLEKSSFETYWTNTEVDRLISLQLQQADADVKKQFEKILQGESIETDFDEQIAFDQLKCQDAVWSLLLACGYLKVLHVVESGTLPGQTKERYTLTSTNQEVEIMFENLIREWFADVRAEYNTFINALLHNDVEVMNDCINRITFHAFHCFGRGKQFGEEERFYHGLVLGLLVELREKYKLHSNWESGLERYDVVLEPLDKTGKGIIMEFKVHIPKMEESLEDTVSAALQQIDEKRYEQELISKGIPVERIYKYGFAFKGKHVLVKGA